MPLYDALIIVNPINCRFKIFAENIGEAKIRMGEKFERLIDDNTMQKCEEIK